MPETHLFEYAVIRFVPRVEREEFVNVGVILYCAAERFLHIRYELNEARLRAFCPTADLDELRERLRAFERVCAGRKEGGTIGQMAPAARFRWLTAHRSTIVQVSPTHPGLCRDAQAMLERLFGQLVVL